MIKFNGLFCIGIGGFVGVGKIILIVCFFECLKEWYFIGVIINDIYI